MRSGQVRARPERSRKKSTPTLADPGVKAQLLYLTALAYRGSGNLPGALKNFDAAGTIDTPSKPDPCSKKAASPC